MIKAAEWNPKQKRLADLLKSRSYTEAISLCIRMHKLLYESENAEKDTFEDRLWKDLDYNTCRSVSKKDTSIVWNIWHLTRIEDLIAGIVIAQKDQLFDENWSKRIKTAVTDTGNAMNRCEVESLSFEVDIDALRSYRRAVGARTAGILSSLGEEEPKRRVTQEQMRKILQSGGVLDHPGSVWLLDYRGKKNISGLMTMPLTRHHVVHLNDAFAIKKKFG